MKSINKHEQELTAKEVFDKVLASAVHIQNFKSYMLFDKVTGTEDNLERTTSECLTNLDVENKKMEMFIQQLGLLSRIYMENETGFALTPEINAWVKLPPEAIKELFQDENPYEPLREMMRLRLMIEDFEVKKDQDISLFVSKTDKKAEEIKELFQFLFQEEETVTQFDCHLIIDAETYFLKEQEIGIIAKNRTGKDTVSRIKLVYSKHNELENIKKPTAIDF